jgi:GAF domain-containing protein
MNGRKSALQSGHRTALCVPLIHAGEAIGVILIRRAEVRPFTERQIELVNTFADQAVIAIENTRLLEAEQARTRELTETLQQQTATANVLKVISRLTFDLQPVLDTLLENATHLCDAESGLIWRFDGEVFRAAAAYGVQKELVDFWAQNPIRPGRGSVTGRAALDRRTVQITDALADPEYQLAESQKMGGYRTLLGVPMLRENVLIGVFGLQRYQVRPFTDKQIDLVTSFTDQAVIAIENTRLFEEVQTRTRDLTEALEQQTATSEVLNVISRSPTDAQPVFDAISKSAARLCAAELSAVYRFDGKLIHVAALTPQSRQQRDAFEQLYPRAPDSRTPVARAILGCRTQHVSDTTEETAEHSRSIARSDCRQMISLHTTFTCKRMPMLNHGIGKQRCAHLICSDRNSSVMPSMEWR